MEFQQPSLRRETKVFIPEEDIAESSEVVNRWLHKGDDSLERPPAEHHIICETTDQRLARHQRRYVSPHIPVQNITMPPSGYPMTPNSRIQEPKSYAEVTATSPHHETSLDTHYNKYCNRSYNTHFDTYSNSHYDTHYNANHNTHYDTNYNTLYDPYSNTYYNPSYDTHFYTNYNPHCDPYYVTQIEPTHNPRPTQFGTSARDTQHKEYCNTAYNTHFDTYSNTHYYPYYNTQDEPIQNPRPTQYKIQMPTHYTPSYASVASNPPEPVAKPNKESVVFII